MSHGPSSPDWGALYREYRDGLLRRLGRYGVPAAERYDLLHRVFAHLMRNHAEGKFDKEFRFGGLAAKQARHSASEYHRSSSRSPVVEHQDFADPASEDCVELRDLFERAVPTWPTQEQEIFRRLFLLGHSPRTVAADLGIALQTVRNLAVKARENSRKVLDETP